MLLKQLELLKKDWIYYISCITEPELSKEAIIAIEKARERIRKGRFLTEIEAKKRLGL